MVNILENFENIENIIFMFFENYSSFMNLVFLMYFKTKQKMEIDGTAPIDTGLEFAGVTESVRQVGSIYNLHRKGGPTRKCGQPLRCLSQFLSHERKKDQLFVVL